MLANSLHRCGDNRGGEIVFFILFVLVQQIYSIFLILILFITNLNTDAKYNKISELCELIHAMLFRININMLCEQRFNFHLTPTSVKTCYICNIKQTKTKKTTAMKTFTTTQEGYGRQGLYFKFDNKSFFIQSVFPNIKEYFGITHESECFYNDEIGIYTDCDGNETIPYSDIDEFLYENYKEEIGKILYESLNHNSYNFDFEKATYEEIADWAINF